MNIKLLEKIKLAIRAYPNQFDMSNWFDKNECGTTACIAGWAVALNKNLPLNQAEDACIACEREAMKALGLTFDEGQRLFYLGKWPPQFVYDSRNAVARIEHFIQTNGAE